MVRRVQLTPGSKGLKSGGGYRGPDKPEEPAVPAGEPEAGRVLKSAASRQSTPAASGLRSRGFLSQGGSPDGEPPRRARGKKSHASVVTEPSAPGLAPRPSDYTIRAKRLPSLKDEKAGDA